jgi:nucleotide-binding universal stress UspA family protein
MASHLGGGVRRHRCRADVVARNACALADLVDAGSNACAVARRLQCQKVMSSRTIICATDFSPCSKAALKLATAAARRFCDKLLLIHVIEQPPFVVPEMPTPPGWELVALENAEAQLAKIASEPAAAGVEVETKVVSGMAAWTIAGIASDTEARMIVVGTHGRKGPARFFLGSVADDLARRAPCPVLVTRADLPTRNWAEGMPLRLAAVADGSRVSHGALAWTGAFSGVYTCDVTVVRLYWPPQEAHRFGLEEAWLGNEGHPILVRLLERHLRNELEPLFAGPIPRLRFHATPRDGAETLAAEVDPLEPDAVVLGVAKHTESWTALSAAAVMRTASCPVLCVPEAAQPAAATIPQVRSVLVGADLSDIGKEAILPAYGLLRNTGGRVELCHVHVRGPFVQGADMPLHPVLNESERAELLRRLEALVPADAARFGITTTVSVVEGASADEGLAQTAERLEADLIVVASHGRSGFKRAMMGSVAEQVARHATRPVLIVRARAR